MNSLPLKKPDWNEIEYVGWKEFRKMAPSILQLEVTRLGRLMRDYDLELDVHNAFVKGRYELKQFVKALPLIEDKEIAQESIESLGNAIMAVSVEHASIKGDIAEIQAYILDRLNYVYNRIKLVY